MPLFRKDPFGPAWVLFSPERGLEASDFGSALPTSERSPLSPGNERRFGREIQAVRPSASPVDSPDWRMRVIEHPSAMLQPKPFERSGDELFSYASSAGYHEIIVEHPDARMRLDNMPREHLTEVLKLYRDRLSHLAAKPDIAHVQITRNVGRAAGAMFDHPHAQVLAVPVTNRWVDEEITAAEEHFERSGRCLYCQVLGAELAHKDRLVSQNSDFVALAPFAAKTPFEMWVLPKQHSSGFANLTSNTLPTLAGILQAVVRALNTALDYPPYNLFLHTLPGAGAAGYHWHIELLPRLTSQAGFDWAHGFYVNPTPPEDAARFLREALALQEVVP